MSELKVLARAQLCARLLTAVEATVKQLIPKFVEMREGGVFCVKNARTNSLLLLAPVGRFPEKKSARYFSFAQEKATRLYFKVKRGSRHLTSWQSRDEEKQRYGGAILADDLILSFSGLPELADEAVVAYVAFLFNLIGFSTALEIANTSNNHRLLGLLGISGR